MLTGLVQVKGWHHFYPPTRIEHLAREISRLDYDDLTHRYGMGSVEVTLELCKIALTDVVIYCDDSGSMKFEDGGDRWYKDLKTIIELSAQICTMFDTDGISLRFMNNPESRDNIRNPQEVSTVINSMEPNGVTPMGQELERKIVQPYFQLLQQQRGNLTSMKPLLVLIITDGVPTDTPRERTRNVIAGMRQQLIANGLAGSEINYQFAQVGRDRGAQQFLDQLDNDPVIGSFIDATSYYEFEEEQWARKGVTLTPYLYILKLLLGGFDPEWDSKDE
jgi:hypothetical protein